MLNNIHICVFLLLSSFNQLMSLKHGGKKQTLFANSIIAYFEKAKKQMSQEKIVKVKNVLH